MEVPVTISEALSRLETKMLRIELLLDELLAQYVTKDFYSTAEVAKALCKAEFTVREWCRLGRIYAEKRSCGRGLSQEWIISREELARIRSHGLLPQDQQQRYPLSSNAGRA
jgi:hypothetical protein